MSTILILYLTILLIWDGLITNWSKIYDSVLFKFGR